MTLEQYEQATEIVIKLKEANSELTRLNEFLADAAGTKKVKIDTRWTFELPLASLRGEATKRKQVVEAEVTDLTNQLAQI